MQSGSVSGPLRALLPSAGRIGGPPMIKRVAIWGVAMVAFYAVAAQARDAAGRYAGSPYAEWFRSQHNSEGQWCCDKSDGHDLAGKPHVIPKHMILTGANPTGHAVWWFLDTTEMGH